MSAFKPSNNIQGALFALAAFAVYATHDVFVKQLGANYSPIQILFFSGLLGFPIVSLMLVGDTTQGNLRPVHPWWMTVRCATTLIGATAGVFAFSSLPLAQAYAILFASPLIITILSIPILGEKVGAHRWGAVFVGLVGVIIVLRPGDATLGVGHIAGLIAALSASTNSVVVRKIGQEERSVVLMMYPMISNFLILGAALPFVYVPMPATDFAMTGIIAGGAFLAMMLLIKAYRLGEAAIVAPMQYSQIIWASIFGYVLFNEQLDRATIIGTAVIIASGLYIVFRENSDKSGSENTPVLRTRSRPSTANSLRIGPLIRRADRIKAIREAKQKTKNKS
ncbi:MAG: DMT family transporter [Pseudoruegeria sp.]